MADRQIVYPGAIPLDTDILNIQRNMMVALGFLAQATLGTTTVVDGLTLSATGPASMTVNVGPGSILALSTVDATAFGSLNSDTSALVKMGVNLTSTPFTLTAPVTAGQSVNYLIEATFAETDTNAVVLPYYNASNPAVAYSGPNNTGATQNTQRVQRVSLQLKAGTPATTGTQTTPATDSGWVALYAIVVNYGQTSITSTQVTSVIGASTAPFVDPLKAGRGILPGRLLNVQTFSTPGTFTYAPTGGTNSIEVEVQGAGGGGGGAPATGAGQISQGGNGGSGSYAKKRVTSGFSGVTVTVGAGGAGASGAAGSAGGSSSFGSIVSAVGGGAGVVVGPTASTTFVVSNPAQAATPSNGDLNIAGSLPSNNFTVSGNAITQPVAPGMFESAYGAGGLSAAPNPASSSALTGAAGKGGIVIVREYS